MTTIENRALYIAEECRKAGMTLAGAAGVLANVEAESIFSPTNVQDTYESRVGNDATYTARVDNGTYHNFTQDAAGYGLVQWTAPDRKAMMLAYCRQRGKSIGDFQTQVAFMLQEIRGYSIAWRTVTKSADAYECGYNVCRYYEIPDNIEAASVGRGNRARYWHDWLINVMHAGAQSTIQPAAAATTAPTGAKKDDEGIEIPQTWPPRTIDSKHCTGWPEIKLMQSLLLCRGYNVVVDGIWTDDTTKKFTAFQTAVGLDPDNVCGPASYVALGISRDIFNN